jgi:hypothetical protein
MNATPDVGLFKLTPAGELPVSISTQMVPNSTQILVTPASPLDANTDYVIRGGDACAGSGKLDSTATTAPFHTGASAPLPAALGALSADAPTVGNLTVWTVSGSCSAPITAAQVKVGLTLSADAAPWQSALSYATFVDGQAWRYSDSLAKSPGLSGVLQDIVYTSCKADDGGADKGVTEGTHAVTMRATLPGTTLMLETAPVSITLKCPAPPAGTGGGGGGAGSGGAGGEGTGGSDVQPSQGGGCSMGSAPLDGAAWLASVLALLVVRGARIRRRR